MEALFSHALRMCRVGDQTNGTHEHEWTQIQQIVDVELSKSKGANFEFSTLVAAYIANIQYMGNAWLKERMSDIFPILFKNNLACAIDGLGYAPATREIYTLLVESGTLDRLLPIEVARESAHERLVERIALAYISADEELTSPRFSYFFAYCRRRQIE